MRRILSTAAVSAVLAMSPPVFAQTGPYTQPGPAGNQPGMTSPQPGMDQPAQPGGTTTQYGTPGTGRYGSEDVAPQQPQPQRPTAARQQARTHRGQSGMQEGAGYGGSEVNVTMQQLSPEMRAEVQGRMGPRQRLDEVVETTLLNRLFAQGYNDVRSFQRTGEFYTAEVIQHNQPMTVRIDPRTGQIMSGGR